MAMSLLKLQLKQFYNSPTNWLLVSFYLLINSYLLVSNINIFFELKNSGSINTSLSNTVFYSSFNVSLFTLMFLMPFIAIQFGPMRQQSGLHKLLFTTPTSQSRFRLYDLLSLAIIIAINIGLFFVLLLPILFTNKIDWGVLISTSIGQILLLFLYVGCANLSRYYSTSMFRCFAFYFGTLVFLWVLQILTVSIPRLSLLSPIQWYNHFSLGIVSLADLMSFLIIIAYLMFAVRLVENVKQRLNVVALGVVMLGTIYFLQSSLTQQYDLTSNQRYTLNASLQAAISKDSSIQIQVSNLSESAMLEVQTRLVTPLKSIAPSIDVEQTVQLDQNMSATSGVMVIINQQPYWIDYPFSQHPQQQLLNHIEFSEQRSRQWILFSSGHQESQIDQQGGRNLSSLASTLSQQGFNLQQRALAELADIPDNVGLVVIANSQQSWLSLEWKLLKNYLDKGGRLLWLREPQEQALVELENYLGVTTIPGTLIDPAGYQAGTPHPAIVLVRDLPRLSLTANLNGLVALPWTVGLGRTPSPNQWQTELQLTTHSKVWTEFEPQQEQLQLNLEKGELEGEFAVLLALTRQQGTQQQRVVITGDVHFLSDSAINNYDNQQLMNNIFAWLMQPKTSESIEFLVANDRNLIMTPFSQFWYLHGGNYLLSIILLIVGLVLWLIRTR